MITFRKVSFLFTEGGFTILKNAVFNAKHKKVRGTKNMKIFHLFVMGGSLSFYCDVLFCGGDAGIKTCLKIKQ